MCVANVAPESVIVFVATKLPTKTVSPIIYIPSGAIIFAFLVERFITFAAFMSTLSLVSTTNVPFALSVIVEFPPAYFTSIIIVPVVLASILHVILGE
jgi:hypothetical protein